MWNNPKNLYKPLRACHSHFIHHICIRNMNSKKLKIIELMRENRCMFGDLHETYSQRIKRIKLENSGKIPAFKGPDTDSEMAWSLKSNTRCKNVKLFARAKVNDNVPLDSQKVRSIKIVSNSKVEKTGAAEQSKQTLGHFKFKKQTITLEQCGTEKINRDQGPRSNIDSIKEVKNNENHNLQGSVTSTTYNNNSYKDLSANSSSSNPGFTSYNWNVNEHPYNAARKTEQKMFRSESIKTPYIVFQNITSFPIIESITKPNSQESGEILSISQMTDKVDLHFPSVSKVLNKTMTPEARHILDLWKQKIVRERGQQGFDLHRKELIDRGKLLHSYIVNTLKQQRFDVSSGMQPCFDGLQHILQEIHNVRAIESHVVHPKLMYRGIVDCVASYRDNLYVIDWKRSEKKKANLEETFDDPLQLASYIGAVNSSMRYPFVLDGGLLIIAYTSGEPADVHELRGITLQKYWNMWLKRLQQYYVEVGL